MTADVRDTIYALSSGSPPAAIAIVRISGPHADEALQLLSGRLPEPRRASVAGLTDPASGDVLDHAILLRFPGPNSSTGEDMAELHLHGGRSVVVAVLQALSTIDGLRHAEPGEFTRRAFENGRIDLTEAEGLSDLLTAETEAQRRAALALAGGMLSRKVEGWRGQILGLSAQLEAALDFADEGDVDEEVSSSWAEHLTALAKEMEHAISAPGIERLRDGIRVVIAGPPNAGKSSLLNALAGRDAAITSDVPGTTRDLVEAPTSIAGTAFLLVDTAGLRDGGDYIEQVGIGRAREAAAAADIILWLGAPHEAPPGDHVLKVQTKLDLGASCEEADIRLSAVTGEGVDELLRRLLVRASLLSPREGEVTLNRRHREILGDCLEFIHDAARASDPLIASEALRIARSELDRITGRAGVEDMLNALFGSFCIGK